MGRRSITLRLTLLFAAASTAVLLALGFVIGDAVERHFVEQDLALLNGWLRMVAPVLTQAQSSAELDVLLRHMEDAPASAHHGAGGPTTTILAGDNGARPVLATQGIAFPTALLDRSRAGGAPLVWRQGEQPWRGIAAQLPTGVAGWPPALVAVAVDITHHEQFMASFRRTLWLFVAFAALATGLLGWAAVRRGLAPLRDIERGADAITASRLDYRLPVGAIPVELAELAERLNAMLARLEDSFRRLSDFSVDLAHELRTPVSNLMTETQVALSKARSTEEYRDVLASNSEEFEHLARMISDMLYLAKADNGLIVPHREQVDLARQVRDLFDYYEALADDHGVQLSLAGEGQVEGDRLMLRRALGNLLSNAIRHTPRGGHIGVTLAKGKDGAVSVAIENTGEPIAPEHLPRIFDRFYRVDPSRHRSSEGAGLGLAITRSIVRAHGGEIAVRTGQDTTCFEIELPYLQGSLAENRPA